MTLPKCRKRLVSPVCSNAGILVTTPPRLTSILSPKPIGLGGIDPFFRETLKN